MHCQECGGKVDKITENNYFCRQCGARQVPLDPQNRTPFQQPGGLLNVVIFLNYVTMVVLVIYGIFLVFFFSFLVIFFGIAPLVSAGILWWVNGILKKLELSRRKFSIIANGFVIIILFYGGIGMPMWLLFYLLAVAVIQYYILYVHQPTVEQFS